MTMESPQPADPTIDAAPQRRRSRWRGALRPKVGVIAASVLALAYVAGVGVWAASTNTTSAATTAQIGTAPSLGNAPSGEAGGGYVGPRQRYVGPRQGYTYPGNGTTSPGTTTSTEAAATTASASESTGLVLIETVLGYDRAAAAGTGVVLTSDGLVLTNNHVIDGSTAISVTIAATGKTYTATVVGTDATDDVALLQLQGATGLATATPDKNAEPAVGAGVTAVGNASGGGVLLAADGVVTQLNSSVTTSSEYTVQGETLGGMIEFDAAVVGGDSGGALLDKQGEVVGITTAASVGRATTVAYAIPINSALAIVDQMRAGNLSAGVKLGYPAFLGVAIARDGTTGMLVPGQGAGGANAVAGAQLTYVYANTPAASVGLVAGDTITAIGGQLVTSADDLSTAISGHKPGDSVSLTWTDTGGATQSATVTLMQGPAA
ncbi:S1C family serine protease [Demequina lutea]|uniref:S1-C subfamily serine protease n=1 Tax=Demequina lutea TaxID=431489 RepID=A0A7Z0CJQ9_9MICO|nr:trypsin-like peptidase domain-containing protein [Demequina lutea]NYI41143.1 S1-C subfamily serine protease [Demequina lutea]